DVAAAGDPLPLAEGDDRGLSPRRSVGGDQCWRGRGATERSPAGTARDGCRKSSAATAHERALRADVRAPQGPPAGSRLSRCQDRQPV
ncbi:MAG: hypothetical protein AVDCRST_MAG59-3013, partial [uncultured Thermomicrobiales bacterium]